MNRAAIFAHIGTHLSDDGPRLAGLATSEKVHVDLFYAAAALQDVRE